MRYVNSSTSTQTITTIEQKIAEDGVFYTYKQAEGIDTDGDTRMYTDTNSDTLFQKYETDTWVTKYEVANSGHTDKTIYEHTDMGGAYFIDDVDGESHTLIRSGLGHEEIVMGDVRVNANIYYDNFKS